jgi:hypothetical protein
MHKVTLALIAATALLGTAASGGSAQAARMATPNSIGGTNAVNDLVKVKFYYWHGHRYCFYFDGWHGRGWYRCKYRWRRGHGWGGGPGWHPGRKLGAKPRAKPGVKLGGKPRAKLGGKPGGKPGAKPGGKPGRKPGGGPGASSMSDIRAKHDIVLLGHLKNGLGFYRFSYNGTDKAFVGVMAQEVKTVMPEAVVRGSDGYLRVNYDKLGIRMRTWQEWLISGKKIPGGGTPVHH